MSFIFQPLDQMQAMQAMQAGPADPVAIDDDSPIDSHSQLNYRVWKKNAPLLYDYIQTTSLVWPSLSVEWFPDLEHDSQGATQRLLVGSYSNGDSQFENLQLLNVRVPEKAGSTGRLSLSDCEYDDEKDEFVSTKKPGSANSISMQQRIPHQGDVNKAKAMPQNPDLIATISNDGTVALFDRTKKSMNYDEDGLVREKAAFDEQRTSGGAKADADDPTNLADAQLVFHTSEGWGLDWNHHHPGQLVSGANDGCIAVWDLQSTFTAPERLENSISSASKKKFKTVRCSPAGTAACHDQGVNAVQFTWFHDSLVGTAGEDGRFKVFDTRDLSRSLPALQCSRGRPINALSFNRQNQYGLALGDDSGRLLLEDLRQLDHPQHVVEGAHSDSVTGVTWNYEIGDCLASSSSDGLVKLWRFGGEEEASSNNSNPVFVHGGHMLGVSDVAWNPHDYRMLASCSDDNSVQVWRPSANIF